MPPSVSKRARPPSWQVELEALLAEYQSAWSRLQLESVVALWDDTEVDPIYIAEELSEVLVSMSNIASHLIRTGGRLKSARVSITDLRTKRLSRTLAVAVFISQWDLVRVDDSNWTGQSRVTAIFRLRSSRWRFIHYMEDSYYL